MYYTGLIPSLPTSPPSFLAVDVGSTPATNVTVQIAPPPGLTPQQLTYNLLELDGGEAGGQPQLVTLLLQNATSGWVVVVGVDPATGVSQALTSDLSGVYWSFAWVANGLSAVDPVRKLLFVATNESTWGTQLVGFNFTAAASPAYITISGVLGQSPQDIRYSAALDAIVSLSMNTRNGTISVYAFSVANPDAPPTVLYSWPDYDYVVFSGQATMSADGATLYFVARLGQATLLITFDLVGGVPVGSPATLDSVVDVAQLLTCGS